MKGKWEAGVMLFLILNIQNGRWEKNSRAPPWPIYQFLCAHTCIGFKMSSAISRHIGSVSIPRVAMKRILTYKEYMMWSSGFYRHQWSMSLFYPQTPQTLFLHVICSLDKDSCLFIQGKILRPTDKICFVPGYQRSQKCFQNLVLGSFLFI